MTASFSVGDQFNCNGIMIKVEKVEGKIITISRSDNSQTTSRYDYALSEALMAYGH